MSQCKICNKLCKSESKHAYHQHKITSEQYYNKFYNKNGNGKCKICHKKTRYKGIDKGYCKYCSDICSSADISKNKKISNAVASIACQQRTKNTNKKKYGCEYALQAKQTKEKSKLTCQRKYNADTPFQSKFIQAKIKRSIIENFGCDNVGQHPAVKDKIKKTCIKKYGCESHLYDKKIQEVIRNYNLKNYGVEYKFQSDEFRRNAMYNGRYKQKYYITKYNNTLYYQTKPEFRFIKWCEFNNVFVTNGDKIPYIFDKKNRYYFCDFKIAENNTWRLIEIKKKHKWWYDELRSGKMKEKVNSAIQFSKKNGYLPYKIKFNF